MASYHRASQLISITGRRIANYRKKNKMSQIDLAHRVGISAKQLSKYETGKNRITIDRLILISYELKTEIIKLLPLENDNELSRLKKLSAEEFLLQMSKLMSQLDLQDNELNDVLSRNLK